MAMKVGQVEDNYVILLKGRHNQYCRVGTEVGRKQADARVLLLQAKRPATYLLFNLSTRIIEDETKPVKRRKMRLGKDEDRKCPQCGREGISLAYQQGLLSESLKWFVKYRCPACGYEWEREDKSK